MFNWKGKKRWEADKGKQRWEAFEHGGKWWVIAPSRRAVSSPLPTEAEAQAMAKRLNGADDAIEAFKEREGDA